MAQRQEETVGEIKHVVKGQEHQHAPCQTKASLARYYAGQRPAFENIGFYYETQGEQCCQRQFLTVRGTRPLSLKLGATVGSQNENDEHGHAIQH